MIYYLRDRFIRYVILITAFIIITMFIARIFIGLPKNTPSRISPVPSTKILPSAGPFRVIRVIDADTIKLDTGDTVRLIGVDAPESKHPEIPVQRFGLEATEFLKNLIENSQCTLEYEPGNQTDKYGRLLAYVFVDGELINAKLIERGYAYAYSRFPFSRQNEFLILNVRRVRVNTGCGVYHLRMDGLLTSSKDTMPLV